LKGALSKAVYFLVALSFFTLATTVNASSQNVGGALASSGNVETTVIVDSAGDAHVLWLVRELNTTYARPGLWYAKYSANGTEVTHAIRIANSTTIQSAELAVDRQNNPVVVWAEDNISLRGLISDLYMFRLNSTASQLTRVVQAKSALIIWPSVAVDNNGISHLVWTEFDPSSGHATVNYGSVSTAPVSQTQLVASYNGTLPFPPEARILFDNSTDQLDVTWGESQTTNQTTSTVNYEKLTPNGTLVSRLELAKLNQTLSDVSIAAVPGQNGNGTFVTWGTDNGTSSIYVSQISDSADLLYVKKLSYPTDPERYIEVSASSANGLYVLWYQPPSPSMQASQVSSPLENVTYLRMNSDGIIVQTGTGVFNQPILGVTVLSNGAVYGVSPDGLVRAVTPSKPQGSTSIFLVVALMSSLSVAGFSGSILIEEGRYRWATLYSKAARSSQRLTPLTSQKVITLLARKPGLKLRDIKRLGGDRPVGTTTLVGMERNELLASVRDGLSRRFYVKGTETGQVDAVRSRILFWILDHPGVWEAQLAKDLGLSQQLVHYHLKQLKDTRLIKADVDPTGSRKLYRFVDSDNARKSESDSPQ
jgi:DNA-binding transcriptional ArsR family regulator